MTFAQVCAKVRKTVNDYVYPGIYAPQPHFGTLSAAPGGGLCTHWLYEQYLDFQVNEKRLTPIEPVFQDQAHK